MKSKVYFTRIITPEKVLEIYEVLGKELIGKIAVKLHSGEEGNQNFLKPDFWRPIIDKLNGTVVECNTAYEPVPGIPLIVMKLSSLRNW